MRRQAGGRVGRWSTTVAGVAVLLAAAGCTGEQEPGAGDPAPSASSPAGAAAPGSTASPSSDDADAAGDEAAAPAAVGDVPADPVATVPGSQGGTVLEVYRLARSGQTLTLTMAALNDGTESVDFTTSFTARVVDFDASGISLLDPVGLQRYLVLRDTEDACLCSSFRSGDAVSVEAGERLFFSASFPAPPDDVDAVTVETPSGSLVDVPITEA